MISRTFLFSKMRGFCGIYEQLFNNKYQSTLVSTLVNIDQMFRTGLWVLINQKAWFLLLLIPDCFCRTEVNFWVVLETTVLCMVVRDKDEC